MKNNIDGSYVFITVKYPISHDDIKNKNQFTIMIFKILFPWQQQINTYIINM
jgi:hypothetical protein